MYYSSPKSTDLPTFSHCMQSSNSSPPMHGNRATSPTQLNTMESRKMGDVGQYSSMQNTSPEINEELLLECAGKFAGPM